MSLPEIFNIYTYKVNTQFFIIFILYLLGLYIYWYQSRKDGFLINKMFDLAVIMTVAGLLIGRIFSFVYLGQTFSGFFRELIDYHSWWYAFSPLGILIGVVVPIQYFGEKWRWSAYRILDIVGLAILLPASIYLLLQYKFDWNYVIPAVGLVGVGIFIILSYLRNKILFSGWVFSIILLLVSAVGISLYLSYTNLIFYTTLITLSVVNIYLRERSHMTKTNLTSSFINSIKDRLSLKKREIEGDKRLLMNEDPYKDLERTSDNSESVDDAILEDLAKKDIDSQVKDMDSTLTRVRRALGLIKVGKYGVCENCGKEIDKARLVAYPEANTCIECARRASQA